MMNFEEITRRLAKLATSHLADANKEIRVMDPAIRSMVAGARLVGRARTVRCHDEFLTVMRSLAEAAPGEVLVIDTAGTRAAVCGELFTTEAARRGLAGIVVDGACRDIGGIRAIGLPVYARSVIPLSAATARLSEWQIPVQCGGVRVMPGDILFGDDDGIVVAAPDELFDLLPAAETIARAEAVVLERVRAGDNLLDLLNFDDHCENVRAGRESALKFLV